MTTRGRADNGRAARRVFLSLLAVLILTAVAVGQTTPPVSVLRSQSALGLESEVLGGRPSQTQEREALDLRLKTPDAPAAEGGFTLKQLRSDPDLTPERFGRYFRDFAFKLGKDRQAPSDFLAARSGDCDDFACLAAEILGEKKYTARLVAVFMEGQTHVVCYVDQVHGYLDYNLRKQASAIQAAGGSLEEIADKVAAYFRNPWRSASEFQYDGTQARFGRIVFAGARTAGTAEQRHRPSDQRSPSTPSSVQTVASAAAETP